MPPCEYGNPINALLNKELNKDFQNNIIINFIDISIVKCYYYKIQLSLMQNYSMQYAMHVSIKIRE